MDEEFLPFNKPFATGNELIYITEAQRSKRLSGDGDFTKRCHAWLEQSTGCSKALLTHSCTAALDMAALLLGIKAGDEIIVPSYTFVSSASAFVLAGGIPVFVDIRPDTLNINESLIEAAITPRTRAIVPVHYAGVSCEMDTILDIGKRHGLQIVEDAAQGILASYKGRALGAIGDLGAFSFHESKNVIAGECGSLLIRDTTLAQRAEIIREKGTDRTRFFRGEVDKYTWQEVGSSYLPSELVAAYLWAQLEQAQRITADRIAIWQRYHEMLATLEQEKRLRRPIVPAECSHNGHMYYVLLAPQIDRQKVLDELRKRNIHAVFHYVPLHSSPAGMRYGRPHGEQEITDKVSQQLIRLPLWVGLTPTQQERIVEGLQQVLRDVS